ncbi:cytochrome P450 [Xylaria sp. FL1777]|nr:cytochrome P450 [Xylaria sp. FL1777]
MRFHSLPSNSLLVVLTGAVDDNSVKISEVVLNLVNRSVARVLVGDPLCNDETWLRSNLQSTVSVGMTCRDITRFPRILRPLIYRWLPSHKILMQSFEIAKEKLVATLRNRDDSEKNANVLRWLIDANGKQEFNPDISFLTNQILFLGTAATRSTAVTIVNALLDLAAYPEHQATLRGEINDVLAMKEGWSLAAIREMKKLDSFLKESQRLNNHLLLSFNRKVRLSFTLSSGVKIPVGTFISMPAYWAARESDDLAGLDEVFRPWRWCELRERAEKQGESPIPYLARTPNQNNLHWGYGRNACPGRFLADAEAQLLLAWIVWNYEVRLPPGQTKRPENLFIGERVIPDPSQMLVLKRCRTKQQS